MSLFLDIEKKVGTFFLNVRLEAETETLALLGASGCGKSMTLKCIAGIEKPDRGRIVVDGVTLFDSEKHIDLSPQERRVGLMFQNYALFPNMTVLDNIRAGAKREKDKCKREEAVQRVLSGFDLESLAGQYPRQLSGGQQQRVALARILVSEPRILLLDEPFSALDSHLRFRLEQEVRNVIRSFGKTVLLVSHDRDEVYRMADKVAVMDDGRVEVCGEKKAVFSSPETKIAAILTGCKNISAVRPLGNKRVFAEDWGVELAVKEDASRANYVGIRMHDIHIGRGENSFRFCVTETVENPFSYTLMVRPLECKNVIPLGWEVEKNQLPCGEVELCLPPEKLLLLR